MLTSVQKAGGLAPKRKYSESAEGKVERIKKLKATQLAKKIVKDAEAAKAKKIDSEATDYDDNDTTGGSHKKTAPEGDASDEGEAPEEDTDKATEAQDKKEKSPKKKDTKGSTAKDDSDDNDVDTDVNPPVCQLCKREVSKQGAKDELVHCAIMDDDEELPSACSNHTHKSCYQQTAKKKHAITSEAMRVKITPLLEGYQPCLTCLKDIYAMKCCMGRKCVYAKSATCRQKTPSNRCITCLRPVHFSKSCSTGTPKGYICPLSVSVSFCSIYIQPCSILIYIYIYTLMHTHMQVHLLTVSAC